MALGADLYFDPSSQVSVRRLTYSSAIRQVFYINLPIGALAVVAILVWVKADPAPGIDKLEAKEVELHGQTKSTVQRLIGLDWLGAVLIVGITTCLILALQDGGIRKPWSAPSVVRRSLPARRCFAARPLTFCARLPHRRSLSSPSLLSSSSSSSLGNGTAATPTRFFPSFSSRTGPSSGRASRASCS